MSNDLIRYIDEVAAANNRTVDWHQVDIGAGTDPRRLSAWLHTAATLSAIDTLRLALARAWILVFDTAGDRYLDGNLDAHATTLHVIAGTWADSDTDRTTTLAKFLTDGAGLNILQPLPHQRPSATTAPPQPNVSQSTPCTGTEPDRAPTL
jgi:hypothetical protein